MSRRLSHILQESFVPVLLLVMALFLTLIYAQYGTLREADAVTLIHIDAQPAELATTNEEAELPLDAPAFAVADTDDPRLQKAAQLIAEKKWADAEAIYQTLLAESASSQVLNDLGVLYLKQGDARMALTYFNQALTGSTIYVRAYFNRALAHAKLGDDANAIADYDALIKVQPHHFEAHYNLAFLYLKQRDHRKAVSLLEVATGLAAGERRARANVALGKAYGELGEKQKARAAYEAAIRLRPDYIAPRLGLAALEDNTPQGRKRALAQFENIFELAPDHPPAYFSLARLHSAGGALSAAEDAYRNAIRFDPQFSSARYNLGLLLLGQRRYTEARAEFEWIEKRDSKHAENYFNLARTAYGLKNYDVALKEYRKAIDLRGGNYPEAHLNQGLVHVALKQYSEAEAVYLKALRLKEQYPEAWYNLGLVHLKQENWDKAKQAFNKALEHDPKYQQAWFNLGVLAGREENDEVAIESYRKALSIRPTYTAARLNLAVRYARKKMYDQAIAEYRTLLDQDDTYAIAWLNLGIAYQETKAYRQAEQALRKLLELEPDNLRAMKALATALAQQKRHEDAIGVLRDAIQLDAGDVRLRVRLARMLVTVGEEQEAAQEFAKALRLDPGNKKIQQELDSLSNNTKV